MTEAEIYRLADRIWAELWHKNRVSTPAATDVRAAIVHGITTVCATETKSQKVFTYDDWVWDEKPTTDGWYNWWWDVEKEDKSCLVPRAYIGPFSSKQEADEWLNLHWSKEQFIKDMKEDMKS
jgi:hypothetical protein